MPISIDRFVEDRRARWSRLAALVASAQGRVTRLSAEETLELGPLSRSATSDRATCHANFASPGTGGNGRAPKPSSATGYVSATPSANVGYAFRKN